MQFLLCVFLFPADFRKFLPQITQSPSTGYWLATECYIEPAEMLVEVVSRWFRWFAQSLIF